MHCSARRKVRRGGIESIGRNRAGLSGTAGDAVDAPGDSGIGAVVDRGRERKCFTQDHAARIGRNRDGDRR